MSARLTLLEQSRYAPGIRHTGTNDASPDGYADHCRDEGCTTYFDEPAMKKTHSCYSYTMKMQPRTRPAIAR